MYFSEVSRCQIKSDLKSFSNKKFRKNKLIIKFHENSLNLHCSRHKQTHQYGQNITFRTTFNVHNNKLASINSYCISIS